MYMKNFYKFPIAIFLMALCSLPTFGQNIITGKVIDSKQVPYEFATVLLLNQKDSSLAKGAITDPDGKFIQVNDAGIKMFGYKDSYRYGSKTGHCNQC